MPEIMQLGVIQPGQASKPPSMPAERSCLECGLVFTPSVYWQLYDKPKCGWKVRNRRKRAKQKKVP